MFASPSRQWLALAVVLTSVSCQRATTDTSLPPLPRLDTGGFRDAVKAEVDKAYRAVQAKPRDAALNGRLGMVLHAHTQLASAAVCYRRAALLDPGSPRWSYYLGVVSVANGEYGEAVQALRETLRRQPEYLPARLKLAESLMASGDLTAAGMLYRRILDDHPGEATAHYGLGRVLAAQKHIDEAAASFRKATALFPGYGAAHYALAQLDVGPRNGPEKERHLEAYRQHMLDVPPLDDPWMARVRRLEADPHQLLRHAVQLEQEGSLELAVTEHERALEIDPGLTQAHVNLISLYGRTGQAEKAEQHYRAAMAINPNLADCHYNYGVLLYGLGRKAEARHAFERALEINPNYPEAHNNLGFLSEEEGDVDQAIAHFRSATANRPGYRLAHFHLGRILLNRQEYEQAIAQFEQTLTPRDENTPGYLYALGAAYARSGQRGPALRYIRQAREQARSYGQTQLLASIDEDLRALGSRP